MTSKIIVKDLADSVTENELKSIFDQYGTVTNVQLKRNANGKSRKFAFVGFSLDESGLNACSKMNNSFIKGARVKVEVARRMTVNSTPQTSTETFNADLTFLQTLMNSRTNSERKTTAAEQFAAKLTNLPASWKREDVQIFLGSKCHCSEISFRSEGDVKKCLVSFSSSKDLEIAMSKNGSVVDGKKVKVFCQKSTNDAKTKNDQSTTTDTSDAIVDTGRLFVRNLSYNIQEDDLETLFSNYGKLVEVHIPIDLTNERPMGFAFVTFMFPESALKAYEALNGTNFHGRTLMVHPGNEPKKEHIPRAGATGRFESSYKKEREEKQKALSNQSYNWNTLFMGANAVVDSLSDKFGVRKQDVLASDNKKQSVAVRVALGETKLVMETKQFLINHGVNLDAFSQAVGKRSRTIMIVKNLPTSVSKKDLETLFSKFGTLNEVIFPPSGLTALVSFRNQPEAKRAFMKLAYTEFKESPLYLEWAPIDCMGPKPEKPKVEETTIEQETATKTEDSNPGVLYVKNLNFSTTESGLRNAFDRYSDKIASVMIATVTKNETVLSRGYGFIEFSDHETALDAIKTLQFNEIDGHKIELKLSNRATLRPKSSRALQTLTAETPAIKIMVRNIPFEVTKREVQQLFSTFGELKFVRMPRKHGS